MKKKYYVIGMTCQACKSHVEKVVSKEIGVEKATVDLSNNRLLIEANDAFNEESLKKAIKDEGYQLSQTEELSKKKSTSFLPSLLFIAVLFYVAMGKGASFPLPGFLTNDSTLWSYPLVQLLLVLPILFLNRKIFQSGFIHLWKRNPNMDTLVAIGSLSSLVYSLTSTILFFVNKDKSLIDNLYYDASGMILVIVRFGKMLEDKAKTKTGIDIRKLMDYMPLVAHVISSDGIEEKDLKDVLVGDTIVVKTGEKIPLDGQITLGEATVDESLMTGESIPVYKKQNDDVFQGCNIVNGHLTIKVVKDYTDTKLSQIISMVEDSSVSKSPISRLADRISNYFVPIVLGLSVITFIVWFLFSKDFYRSLTFSISVLVISCPCALGLSTPLSIVAGIGVGAKKGILFKSAIELENLGKIKLFCFDKTGTLTQGVPYVIDQVSTIEEQEFLAICKGIEEMSIHPLSKAVLNYTNPLSSLKMDTCENVVGEGIITKRGKDVYYGGNAHFMEKKGIIIPIETKRYYEEGKTVLFFAKNNQYLGLLTVLDDIKKDSKEAIKKLKELGIKIVMISGDQRISCQAIGRKLGIEEIRSEMHPLDKLAFIEEKINKGEKIVMIGDGINDSPSLSKSTIGIAMGKGTDIAIDSSNVVLMHNHLMDLVNGVLLSRATIRNIKISLLWAFIYNLLAIPLAMGVFYPAFHWSLNPMIASLLMMASSLCVSINALLLRKFKGIEEKKMETKLIVKGMMCENCKRHVYEALIQVEGVKAVEIDLKKKTVLVQANEEISIDTLKEAVLKAGYVAK